MQQAFRLEPAMSPESYNTYSIRSPRDVKVKAACEQVGCERWLKGWKSPIDESTDLGKAQAAYIRTQSGRTFKEQRTGAGLTVFVFDSRQRCFTDHKTWPETYAVARGDWRRSTVTRMHTRPGDWVDDFASHQQQLADRLTKG